jgi:hypothetical protein
MDRSDWSVVTLNLLDGIYGKAQAPYFIYTPRWISSSAGIKALHYLCHALNSKGMRAYLVLCEGQFNNEPRVNPDLFTPILTQEISDAYFKAKQTPIVIYSETIPGNPLGATCVVRYLMNFAGALGGSSVFDETEVVISFSKKISQDYAKKNNLPEPNVLFIPPIDPREFSKFEEKEPFQVVYAGKYRSFIGKPPKVGTLKSVEIFRDGPRMQTREQVKEILKRASVLYSFENSSIVTEAILSGTPARLVPNEFLGDIIAEVELGNGGIILGDTPSDMTLAIKTIDDGIARYYQKADDFLLELEKFISETQKLASFEGYQVPVIVPVHNHILTQHRLGLAKQIIKKQGFSKLLRVSYHFAMRRLSWRYWAGKEEK